MNTMKRFAILALILAASVFVSAATCGTGVTSGMIGYWKLDLSSGVVLDSFDGNDGTNNGATRGITGQINNAFSFDGSSDYVGLGDPANGSLDVGSGNFTVEAWVNTTDTNAMLISKGTTADFSYDLFIIGDSLRITFYQSDGSNHCEASQSSTTANDGDWHHVAGVWDEGTDCRLYLDGSLVATDNTLSGTFNDDTAAELQFARRADGALLLDGNLDEIAIYDKALSSSDIMAHFTSGDSGNALCEISESIPEVSNSTLQIFVLLIVALLIGAAFFKKK